MNNGFLVATLAFISLIALALFSSNDSNAEIFSVILLILIFLVEKQVPTDDPAKRENERL